MSHSFFTIPEYENWRNSLHTTAGWKIKYYKGNHQPALLFSPSRSFSLASTRVLAVTMLSRSIGLGTSTPQEAKEYFSDIDR